MAISNLFWRCSWVRHKSYTNITCVYDRGAVDNKIPYKEVPACVWLNINPPRLQNSTDNPTDIFGVKILYRTYIAANN